MNSEVSQSFKAQHSFNYTRETEKMISTYTINRSQSAQIFCPAGRPPVEGGAGRVSGACTCFVTGVTDRSCECEYSSKL